ncbi:MAG TPA: hypothetical protein VFQ23_05945 [Anaerolineales bacterium]|nr:hypothetical protein [Anaerolineales bacterium]
MKTKSVTLLLGILIALMTFACIGGGAATPTSEPADVADLSYTATSEPVIVEEGEVKILNSTSYLDRYNDYYVVGELLNDSNQMIENIVISLSIMDESGASLLKDDNDNPVDSIDIYPYIDVLSPGTSAPFSYYISIADLQPATYEVTVRSYDRSSASELKEFDVQNVQTHFMENGDVVLAGEIVNLDSNHVDVESLAGTVLDSTGTVLAANSTMTYSRYLYPAGDVEGRDRGPFVITLYGPIENVSQWKIFARSIENTTVPAADLDIELAGSYVDGSGTYHLLGTVTNNGSSQVSPSVVGGLYGEDTLVWDAATSNIPLYLNSGDSAPFDLSTFQVVPYMSPDQMSAVDEIVVPDLYWSYSTDYQVVSLAAEQVELMQGSYDWTLNGSVVNSSGENLSRIIALVQFLDENGQVMATNSTTMFPAEGSDAIEPGVSTEFSISIYASEDWNLSSQAYQVILQGVIAE